MRCSNSKILNLQEILKKHVNVYFTSKILERTDLKSKNKK